MPAPRYILALLLTVCFTMATSLQPASTKLNANSQSTSLLTVLLGDGRRIFANHFFTKADVYFHSGYYPSFFHQSYAKADKDRDMENMGKEDHAETAAQTNFLGNSEDWIDTFGRHFYSAHHSHLEKPGEAREILPWLEISAELDPQKIDTYTVASYWMRTHMNRAKEAEQFLRQGLRANPTSYEILYELGNIYNDNYHNPAVARNIWELALQRWIDQNDAGKEPSEETCEEIMTKLAQSEEEQGNLEAALNYLDMDSLISPQPDAVEQRMEELKEKIAKQAAR